MAGGGILDILGLILFVVIIAVVLGLIIYTRLLQASNFVQFINDTIQQPVWQDTTTKGIYRVEGLNSVNSPGYSHVTKRWYSPAVYNSWGRPAYSRRSHDVMEKIPLGPDMEFNRRTY